MPATGWLTSPTGLVLGGVTACLADFALGAAMHTTVPPGTAVAPTDLRVRFIRPAPGDGPGCSAAGTPPRPPARRQAQSRPVAADLAVTLANGDR
jgi:acyl-coenzyme A thioesterase PaaI-like protein